MAENQDLDNSGNIIASSGNVDGNDVVEGSSSKDGGVVVDMDSVVEYCVKAASKKVLDKQLPMQTSDF